MRINGLASHRNARIFLRDTEGGSGGGGGGSGAGGSEGGQNQGSGGSNSGDTGGSEFTPITSQEEFDRRISRRLSQVQSRYADYDTKSEKAAAFDALEAESRTEHERQVAETKDQTEKATAAKFIPRLVTTEFKVAAVGKLSEEQVTGLLEDLDFSKYVKDDGEPDTEKIVRKVTTLAGKNGSGGRGPDLGQGNGHGSSGPAKGESGASEAKRRFGEKAGNALLNTGR